MWRIGFDINASWASVMSLVDQDAALSSYAGPGHWNDPDMLEVGNGLAANEDQSHFSMWAMLAAPLLAGNDLRSMSSATRTVLTNTDVIAVDQDPLGAQGKLVATPATNLQVWSKTLSGTNARAVALLNRTSASASITVPWSALGLPAGSATVRDLWGHTDLGTCQQLHGHRDPEPRRRDVEGGQLPVSRLPRSSRKPKPCRGEGRKPSRRLPRGCRFCEGNHPGLP